MDRLHQEIKISSYIAKQIADQITEDEKEYLQNWIDQSESNKDLYKRLINSLNTSIVSDDRNRYDLEIARKRVMAEYSKRSLLKIVYKVTKYAAIIILPLLIVALFHLNQNLESPQYKSLAEVAPGGHKAVLILSDGSEINLEQHINETLTIKEGAEIINGDSELIYLSQKNSQLTYDKEVINTILTPVRGEYSVTLSDGTKIWLNSKSKLEYPIKFLQNKRVVKLSGEAYFEVAHDASKPFVVQLNDGTTVNVLGTSFNISAYDDDRDVLTTLVDGSVQVNYENNKLAVLKPGEQLDKLRNNHTYKVMEVDPAIYTSWKDGRFVFDRESLEHIMVKLERWYGVSVFYNNQGAKQNRISANLERYESIDKLLNLISEVAPVYFELKNNAVVVHEKN